MEQEVRKSRAWIVVWFLLLVNILPLWATNFVPLGDFQHWLLEAKILADYHNPQFHFPDFYQFKLYPYPNTLAQVVMVPLLKLFPTQVAGNIFNSLSILIFALGIYWLLSLLNPESGVKYLGFALAWCALFVLGCSGNYLGNGMAFLTLAWFWKNRQNDKSWFYAALALALLLNFFAHAVSFLALAMCLGLSILWSRRGVIRKLFILCFPSFIAGVIFLWKSREIANVKPEITAQGIFSETLNYILPFYAESSVPWTVLPTALLNAVFCLSLAECLVVLAFGFFKKHKLFERNSLELLSWFLANAAILVLAPNRFTSSFALSAINARFSTFALVFAFAWLAIDRENKSRLPAGILLAWSLAIPLWLGFIFYLGQPQWRGIHDFVKANVKPEAKTFYFNFIPINDLPLHTHLLGKAVDVGIPAYVCSEIGGCFLGIYPTGIVNTKPSCSAHYDKVHNYTIEPTGYFSENGKDMSQDFTDLFIIGLARETAGLKPVLAPYFDLKAEGPYGMFYEAKRP